LQTNSLSAPSPLTVIAKNLFLRFNARNTATLVKIVVSKGVIDVD